MSVTKTFPMECDCCGEITLTENGIGVSARIHVSGTGETFFGWKSLGDHIGKSEQGARCRVNSGRCFNDKSIRRKKKSPVDPVASKEIMLAFSVLHWPAIEYVDSMPERS